MNDEFYIGYRKVAPPRLARFARIAALVAGIGAAAAAVGIGAAQHKPGNGRYAFGTVETFEGPLRGGPVLQLEVAGDAGSNPSYRQAALLVGQGKHGPADNVRQAAGNRVRLAATRIERDGVLMLELNGADSFEVLGEASFAADRPGLTHTITLTGELVDTKCYLGVMNPGRGKVHRGCAAECLRGGVPAGLVIPLTDGGTQHIVLEPPSDAASAIDPEWAGRLVTVTGLLESENGLTSLRVTQIGISK